MTRLSLFAVPLAVGLTTLFACSGDDDKPPPAGTGTPDAGTSAPAPTATELDLGEIRSGEDVSFQVPTNALGFNLTVEGSVADFNAGAQFGVEEITAPDGTIVHEDFTPAGGNHDTSTAIFDTIAAVSVPQSENVPTSLGGAWTFRVGVKDDSLRRVTTRARVRIQTTTDGVFRGATLDLHLHVPEGLRFGSATVNPAEAASSVPFQQRLDLFFQVTERLLGIRRGKVVFHRADASFATIDGVQEIADGFAVSKDAVDGSQELHMLFTNQISDDGEAFAAGIAAGVPGAATVFGRGVSGIIIAASEGPDDDVSTMIHEMGHFIGLNHTTEFDGTQSDPLDDTPRCSNIEVPTNFQNLRTCPDRTNVMFAAGAIEGPITLSATQKRIYQASPIFRTTQSTTLATRGLAEAFRPASHYRLAQTGAEQELSLGFCGLNPVDAAGLVKRHGRAALAAAASDASLHPVVRGRARLALKRVSAAP